MKKILPFVVVIIIIAMVIIVAQQNSVPSERPEPDQVTNTATTTELALAGEEIWFACVGGTRIRIIYGENTATAALSYRDEVYSLTRTESASGARYIDSTAGIEFWEYQGEATVSLNGTETVCQLET